MSKPSFLEHLSSVIYSQDYDFNLLKDLNFNDYDMSNIIKDGHFINPIEYCAFHQLDLRPEQWNYLIELFCTTHTYQDELKQEGNTFLTIIGYNSKIQFSSKQYLQIMNACSMDREDTMTSNALYYLLEKSNRDNFSVLLPCFDKAIEFFFHPKNARKDVKTSIESIDFSQPMCSTLDNINILFNYSYSKILPYALSKIKEVDWFISYIESYKEASCHIQEHEVFIAFKEQRILQKQIKAYNNNKKIMKV